MLAEPGGLLSLVSLSLGSSSYDFFAFA